MYTIDTSVFVRDFDMRDPEHVTCRALLHRLATDTTSLVVPMLLLVEIAGVISRERRDPIAGRLAVEALRTQPHIRFISLDDSLAQTAADIAADYALRGADAVHVAVAYRYNCTLISLDREQRERSAALIVTR